jgi:hypothetical protein
MLVTRLVIAPVMVSTLGLDRLSLREHKPVDFGADGEGDPMDEDDEDDWDPVSGNEEQELGDSQQPSNSSQGDVNMDVAADTEAQQPQTDDGDKQAPQRSKPRAQKKDLCKQCVRLKKSNPNTQAKKRPEGLLPENPWSRSLCAACNEDRGGAHPYDCANHRNKNPQSDCFRWVANEGDKCSACQRIDKATLRDAKVVEKRRKEAAKQEARKRRAEQQAEAKRLREAKEASENQAKVKAREEAAKYKEANRLIREQMGKILSEPYGAKETASDPEAKEKWENDFLERFGSPDQQKAINSDGTPVVDNAERPPRPGDPRDERSDESKETIKRYTTDRADYMDTDPNGCCLAKKK